MSALALNFGQFEPLFGSELGVKLKHFDGEGDFIDHALSVRLHGGPKFKVLRTVICSLTIDVMNIFKVSKFSTYNFFHHIAMFKNFSKRKTIGCRDTKNHVPAFYPLGYSGRSVFLSINLAHPFVFALTTAKLLFSVNGSSTIASGFCEFISTILTDRLAFGVRCCAIGFSRATHAAVHRVSSKFLNICSVVGFHHNKIFSAPLAQEINRSTACGKKIFFESVSASTSQAAVNPSFLNLALVAVERVSAVFTNYLNRHGSGSSFRVLGGSAVFSSYQNSN